MNNLPQDPFILFSFINMKLRDEFDSLDELCRTLDVDKDILCDKLSTVGFEYDSVNNCFS